MHDADTMVSFVGETHHSPYRQTRLSGISVHPVIEFPVKIDGWFM
jgi:hypothetical protein